MLQRARVVGCTCSARGLSACRPSPTDFWLYLESDAELIAAPAADNEGAADQMLSSSLEFLELLAVPIGHFPVEIAYDVAVDQYCNDCRVAEIARYECRQVSVELVTPWPGSVDCFAQRVLESARTDDGGNLCAPAAEFMVRWL